MPNTVDVPSVYLEEGEREEGREGGRVGGREGGRESKDGREGRG